MAYYSKNSDARLKKLCAACLHEDPKISCPIALVCLNYNYDQLGNKPLEECLSTLVDAKKGCMMRPHIMALKTNPKPDKETISIFKKNKRF